eukprot:TRINITY_DN35535_c0_g1_i1.p1 TRINITY_DN35535_c0_g1~~TRINITY_DN35535_c0_g1_i1.p1  ORF type:complete len:177 (+),score=25.17 TRINITY_DN35535_c0_g1_i1:74-604(+)
MRVAGALRPLVGSGRVRAARLATSQPLFRSAQRNGKQAAQRLQRRAHGEQIDGELGEGPLRVHWVSPDGRTTTTTRCHEGQHLLKVAHDCDLNVEGACEGACACSTCHIVVDQRWFSQLPEATEDEEDMLDQAFELTPQSRLGCQVKMTPELSGMTVRLPRATRNMYVDGHVPHHH